jgi:enoyl-CoA hydratase
VPHGMISGISAVTLPHLIGQGPAMDMMLSARRVPADEALRMGLVHQLITGDVLAAALEFARRLASYPPVSVAATKHLLMLELRHQVRKYLNEIDQARVAVADAANLNARA